MKREGLAARLMATFVSELEEQVELMNTELLELEAQPADAERIRSLFRIAHTLKGAARAVDVRPVERICHGLESLLDRVRDGALPVDAALLERLYAAADALAEAGGLLQRGAAADSAEISRVADALHGAAPGGMDARPSRPSTTPAPPRPAPAAAARVPASPPAAASSGERIGGQVRLDAARVDDLFAATTRLDAARIRSVERHSDIREMDGVMQRIAAQWRRLSRRLQRLEQTAANRRLRDELHSVEDDLRLVTDLASRLAAGSDRQMRSLDHAVRDVTDRVYGLRMRPFSEACEGLPRAVRDLAETAGKEISLDIRGGNVEADRAVLDGIRDAMLQLVRNAIDHGIETPAARQAAGKDAAGTVTVEAALVGDRLQVSVTDDGAGLDLPGIRERLEQRGRVVPDNDAAVARALFEVGVSTRAEATAISGRGVGLDVVRHALESIRGTVDVTWTAGRGTRFVLRCPPTLATLRAVIASVGSVLLAVPSAVVERMVRVRTADVAKAEGNLVLTGFAAPVPLVSVARLLPGLTAQPREPLTVIVAAVSGRRMAFVVDELLAEQDIILRPLDPTADPSPHLSGAALLGPGRVALVLNPVALAGVDVARANVEEVMLAEVHESEAVRTILVVDDSITTRTLEQSVLAAAGYRVVTAVDGADGWNRLQQEGADLVVTDVEMPRMDGFGLCEAIRGSQRFSSIPVILVTALESEAHRARGLEAGADAYITKSAFDQTSLLDTVRQLLG